MSDRSNSSGDPEYGLSDLVWPPALILPARPPQLLYLDLNHWIGLARADRGKGEQSYVDLLDALRRAGAAGRIRVVMTASLFREISKIGDPARRPSLIGPIAVITDFTYLASLADVFQLELQAVLDVMTNTRGLGFDPVELLGRTALHAMGRVGGLRIMRDGVDVTSELIEKDPNLQARLAEMERVAEEALLAGPANEAIPALRAAGYRPEIPHQHVRDNAAFEREWSQKIAPYRAAHHVRDLVIARHVALELMDMVSRELSARRLILEQVISDRTQGRELVMRMPSSAVVVSLLAQYHQDPNKAWKQNDIYDIDALAVAVPYCDIVFTDAAARDALMRRGLDNAMSTALPRRPEELNLLL